ncbi:type II toxin-antitoxin system PemK/MazF family toxin [Pleomorphomonas carboxyditropha]|uniref:type II toxin-antitoxin system PemK/MazF family toxin n=1 Tax=Pleomorphomonas carboxyditropha TaxID=2023338 RepID=UPI001FE06331|nr:type II toxin-antitoxin system PemK/MazF family toxin [Pleomorphomonas carboxyditropha]
MGEEGKLLWVAMITSAENRPWPGDVEVGAAYRDVGLPAPSVIRPVKIATIEASSAEKLGHVTASIMSKVADEIREYLGL